METPVTQENVPQDVNETTVTAEDHVILDEVKEQESYGQYTGHTKWFNDKLGYGFITICDGDEKGKDIFVHHSGIKPLNSNYKTLRKGEYIQFNIINGMNGLQAVDVTGIKGGPLMCDYVTSKRVVSGTPPPPKQNGDGSGWQTVARKPPRAPPASTAPRTRPSTGPSQAPVQRPVKNTAKYNKTGPKTPA
jgi:CspA family cold shock protein